ncbi:Na/Pi cotransporter family protein [Rhodobacteraceae bacterium F11138]|nr:Na/Pi cotransporter family protein [Rhodobacteraceae bacterium F11138]
MRLRWTARKSSSVRSCHTSALNPSQGDETISGTLVLLQIAGSVTLMLWGIRLIRTGIMRAFGGSLRATLARAMNGRMSSFAVGLGVTIFLQSSTATALLVSSFAAKGLVSTTAALAVMLGADIGTSIAAQILSFNPTWLAYVAVFIGVVLHGRSTIYARRQIGRALLGLGLVLLALNFIRISSEPLRESEVLGFVFAALEDEVLLTMFLTAILTWLVHSSLAVVLLIAALSTSGVVPLGTGLVMVLGANIGGTVPPILATLSASGPGQHAAIGNACFKLCAALLVLPFVPMLQSWLQNQTNNPQIMVHVHMGFNFLVAVLFLPWVGSVAEILKRNVPNAFPAGSESLTKYLDRDLLSSPTIALTSATRELYRVNELVEKTLALLKQSVASSSPPDPAAVSANRAQATTIVEEVKLFLTEITREEISDTESRSAMNLLLLATNLWHVSDLVANAADQFATPSDMQYRFSSEGEGELLEILEVIQNGLHIALSASLHNDDKVRKTIQKQRKELEKLVDKSRSTHFSRLEVRNMSSINTTSLHNELLRDFSRIYYHIHTAAKVGA